MNSFIKNNKQVFSLLVGILLSSSLHALTINNQPLDSIVPRGKTLFSTCEEKDNLIMLEMKNGNLNLTWYDVTIIDNTLKELFQYVSEGNFGPMSSKMCNLSSNIVNYNSLYLVEREKINIQTKTSLNLTHCLFESPLISITGNTMNFYDCFLINPKVLKIIGDYAKSDYKVIQIIFHDQPKYPTTIDGEINLKDSQTTKKLILSNVKKITIEFNSQAWDN